MYVLQLLLYWYFCQLLKLSHSLSCGPLALFIYCYEEEEMAKDDVLVEEPAVEYLQTTANPAVPNPVEIIQHKLRQGFSN